MYWPHQTSRCEQVHCTLLQHLTQHHEEATSQLAQQMQQAKRALQESTALHEAEVIEAELEFQNLTEDFHAKMKQVQP